MAHYSSLMVFLQEHTKLHSIGPTMISPNWQQGDEHIMDESFSLPKGAAQTTNKVQLYLQLSTLAEITNHFRKHDLIQFMNAPDNSVPQLWNTSGST